MRFVCGSFDESLDDGRIRRRPGSDGVGALSQTPDDAAAAQVAKGQAAFSQRCKDCHDPAVGEAPDKATLAMKAPDDIFNTLKSGLMQPMADGLIDDEMHAIAAYLTTKPAAS